MIKRNIIVILCDQLRKDFLHAYGCDAVPTPNIDKLAKRGVVFENAITQAPVCAPARASMMTGRYVSDHGVWANDMPFRDGMEYLPQRMNELDYITGAFGKLHHFPMKDTKGFQYANLMEENRFGEQEEYFLWLKERHPEVKNVFNYDSIKLHFNYSKEEYYEHWIADKAIEFIGNSIENNADKPFFAWISFQGPHIPIDPPIEYRGTVDVEKLPKPIELKDTNRPALVKYRSTIFKADYMGIDELTSEDVMTIRTRYAEQIVAIDMEIGRILELLSDKNVYDNTTIIFSADHGELAGDLEMHYKGPFPYRGQLEVPMIVSNHPRIENRKRSKNLVGNIDIPGTVLDIAGDKRGIGYSRSLLDLADELTDNAREWNYSEFCDSAKIVENKRYRYCYYPFTGQSELFDKEADKNEQKNLSGNLEYAGIESECLKAVIDFMVIAKGVRMEARDMIPEVQNGLSNKNRDWQKDFLVAFPLSDKHQLSMLNSEGLSSEYNKFCEGKQVIAHYGLYWGN